MRSSRGTLQFDIACGTAPSPSRFAGPSLSSPYTREGRGAIRTSAREYRRILGLRPRHWAERSGAARLRLLSIAPAPPPMSKPTKPPLSLPEFVALFSLTTSLTALSIDAMLPALRDIGTALAVAEANDTQLIVGLFILGMVFGEIVFGPLRSEEHTSELQSLMRISYAVFCLKK